MAFYDYAREVNRKIVRYHIYVIYKIIIKDYFNEQSDHYIIFAYLNKTN